MSTPEIRIVERVEPDKSKHHLFTQGAVEIEVFPDDVIKSIDQIDKLPVGKWSEFAIQNNLPCEPLDRKLLKGPLMGIIQLAWHQHFKGSVSEKLIANQERRIATYKEDLEHVKLVAASPQQRAARAKNPNTNTGVANAAAIGALFRLKDETTVTWSQYKSQKGLIVAVMISANATEAGGKAITKDQIVAALRGKLNTRQPEERVVGYYMSEWKKEGIVEQVGEAVPKGEVPEGFVPTDTPTPAAEPAKPAEPAAAAPESKPTTKKKSKK